MRELYRGVGLVVIMASWAWADNPRAADRRAYEPELQTIDAHRFGVTVELPAEWAVVQKEQNDQAFAALIAPAADGDRPGFVGCEVGVAPENLDAYRTRIAANAKRERAAGRMLVRNELRTVGARRQLESLHSFETPTAGAWNELQTMLISHGQLYTFTLSVPKATYDTLLPSFERMVRAARFSTPDTGLLPLADGSLMQRDFRFSLRVPAGWKPSFAPSDQVLFFAGAAPTGIWTNNMLVIAGPARALDLDALARRLPGQIEQANPRAKVLQCKPVPQGPSRALETIVEVRQGPFRITVLERRFQAKRMNYEVKYTVRSDDFPALAKELRRSADSFHELPVPAAPKPRVRL